MGLLSVPLKTILPYHADLQNESIPESYAVCDGTTLLSTQQDINPGGTYTVPDLRNVFLLGADITKAATNAGNTSVGASGAPGPKGSGGAHSKTLVTAELPSHSHTGTVANAGAHTHAGSSTDASGSHSHTGNTTTAGAHTHNGSTSSLSGAHAHSGSSMSLAGQHSHTVVDPGHSHSINRQVIELQTPSGAPVYLVNVRDSITNTEGTNVSTTGITLAINGDHVHTLNIATDGNHTHSLTITSDGSHTHPLTIDAAGSHTHTITLLSDGDHGHSFTGGNTGNGQSWDTRPQYYGIVYIMKVKT